MDSFHLFIDKTVRADKTLGDYETKGFDVILCV